MYTYENRIMGYHVNFEMKLNNFVQENKMCASIDNHFLGTGMYFWDSIDGSKYWVKRKKNEALRKSIKDPILTVSAFIHYNSDQLLDLCSPEIFEVVMKLKLLLIKAHRKNTPKLESLPLGSCLDSLFESDNSMVRCYMNNYKVVRVSIRYSGYEYQEIRSDLNFYNSGLPSTLTIDFNNRVIYNVKDNSNIEFNQIIEREVAS